MRFTFASKIALALALVACPTVAFAELPDVVGKVDGEAVTKDELIEAAGAQLMQLRQQEYQILSQAFARLVDERLLEAAAEKAGLTLDEYVEQKIEAKISAPTEEEMKAFYEQYKNDRSLAGRSYDEVKPQIEQYLRAQAGRTVYESLINELRAAAEIEDELPIPRADVAEADNPVLHGPAEAPVTIVAFSDYQCPYCARAEATIEQIGDKYGEKVRIVFRDYPLPSHSLAQKAHEAAGCAHEQGKFKAMHDKLFENQRALQVENLHRYASEVGLDVEQFKACLESDKRADEVQADFQAGSRAGVSGTPAFFVNGRFVNGAVPLEDFVEIIDEELSRQDS